MLHYSDRSAFDVTWVSEDGNRCKIRRCKCIYTGSGYGDESYTYEPDPEAHEVTLEWNPRKGVWQKVYFVRRLVKARLKELQANYGVWRWTDGLLPEHGVTIEDITYGEDDPEYIPGSAFFQYKDVPGLTKEYKEAHDISIIFGTRQEYRDPSF